MEIFEEAETEERKGNNAKARDLYTRFIDTLKKSPCQKDLILSNKLALAYNNRGFLKYLTVDFDGAVEDYTASINLNPELSIAYYNRGTVHYRMGRFDDAIADMKTSLSLNPSFEDAKTGLKMSEEDRHNKLNRGW